MSEQKKQKQMMLTRKSILLSTLVVGVFAVLMGVLLMSALTQSDSVAAAMAEYHVDPTILIILFTVMVLFLYLPLLIGGQRVYDLDETGITLIPILHEWDKWRIMGYILCNDTITPFLRHIPYEEIKHGVFSVEKKFGTWAFSRYTYVLKFYLAQTTFTVYINPMDNGPLLPSGRGGYALAGKKSRQDICNMIQFLKTHEVQIDDPYHILNALQDSSIVIYDYLETLPLRTKY